MQASERSFVPAAGHDWLLPLYDPLWKLIGGDSFRRTMLERVDLQKGQRVLDIGCGTGSLAVAAQTLHPEAVINGLDPDPKALARARRKAQNAGTVVRFEQGFSDQIPCSDGSFDVVLSSFMFHHLQPEEQERTLSEVLRVLAPGGALHLVDFGGSQSRKDGKLARLLHGHDHVHEDFVGAMAQLMQSAGFVAIVELDERRTLFGSVAHYRGSA